MQLYVNEQGVLRFSHEHSQNTPVRQYFKLVFLANINETAILSAGLRNKFLCIPQRFSLFHENFRIKDFDMFRFSSQKIVNLSGTQHSSFCPLSGLLPLASDTPPFLTKKTKPTAKSPDISNNHKKVNKFF